MQRLPTTETACKAQMPALLASNSIGVGFTCTRSANVNARHGAHNYMVWYGLACPHLPPFASLGLTLCVLGGCRHAQIVACSVCKHTSTRGKCVLRDLGS